MMKNLMQFIKFGIVGVSNTAIALAVYYFLLWIGAAYLLANTVSWIVSVFNAFYWNNRYVFKNDIPWFKALIKTYISYGASFVAASILLVIFVEWFGISDKIAPLLTLIISIPMNFILNKYWTFKKNHNMH